MRLKFWKPRSFRVEMETLEEEHHEDTENWDGFLAAFNARAEQEIPFRRQSVYKNGHHCGGCGTPTPGPLCARCVQKQKEI